VKKGVNSLARVASSMPRPSSTTVSTRSAPARRAVSGTVPDAGVVAHAFARRLMSACLLRFGSSANPPTTTTRAAPARADSVATSCRSTTT
jgi:hypothetical protein